VGKERAGGGGGGGGAVAVGVLSLVVGLARALPHVPCVQGNPSELCFLFPQDFFSWCVCVKKKRGEREKRGGNFNVTTGKAGGRQLAVREAGLPTVCPHTKHTDHVVVVVVL
jgi:hypothetical protein